jgi:hypothetical protein
VALTVWGKVSPCLKCTCQSSGLVIVIDWVIKFLKVGPIKIVEPVSVLEKDYVIDDGISEQNCPLKKIEGLVGEDNAQRGDYD